MGVYLLLGLGAVIVIAFIVAYNRIVAMRRLTENAWADVDVFLKRRADLVPNLVQVVKGSADYERETLERITTARTQAVAIDQPTPTKAAAESELTTGIHRAILLAEGYPQLQANQSFLKLQHDLTDVEKLIANARQYYNACVRDYNTMIESFPQSLVAGVAGMKPMTFFEIEDHSERAAPGVSGL